MKIDILTLFPEMFAPLEHSIVGKAREKGTKGAGEAGKETQKERAAKVHDRLRGRYLCVLYGFGEPALAENAL